MLNEKIYNGKYKTIQEKPIGSGSFGSVYLVENIHINKTFVFFFQI